VRQIAFYRQFSFDVSRLSKCLKCIIDRPSAGDQYIGVELGVNPYLITGLRGWLRKIGALHGKSQTKQNKSHIISPVWKIIHQYDPYWSDPGTLWIAHYFLCIDYIERAEAWHRCFNEILSPGMLVTSSDITDRLVQYIETIDTNMRGIKRDAQELLTMYTRPQALGALGLLSGSGSGAQRQYTAHASAGPPDLIAAYMLFDRWQRRADGEGSVRLSALGRDPEWVGRICLMPPGAIRALIDRLERRGLVAFADTQYEPVTRRYTGDPAELVQRHYAER